MEVKYCSWCGKKGSTNEEGILRRYTIKREDHDRAVYGFDFHEECMGKIHVMISRIDIPSIPNRVKLKTEHQSEQKEKSTEKKEE